MAGYVETPGDLDDEIVTAIKTPYYDDKGERSYDDQGSPIRFIIVTDRAPGDYIDTQSAIVEIADRVLNGETLEQVLAPEILAEIPQLDTSTSEGSLEAVGRLVAALDARLNHISETHESSIEDPDFARFHDKIRAAQASVQNTGVVDDLDRLRSSLVDRDAWPVMDENSLGVVQPDPTLVPGFNQ